MNSVRSNSQRFKDIENGKFELIQEKQKSNINDKRRIRLKVFCIMCALFSQL